MSAPERAFAPAAMASAVSALTTPKREMISVSTPSSEILASSEYVTYEEERTSEAPGTSLIAEANMPPVQDSAAEICSPFFLRRPTVTSLRSSSS